MAVKKKVTKETKVNTAPVEVRVKEVDDKVALALKALNDYASFDQEKIDYIVAKCTVAALDQHGTLAKMAIDETGRGVFEDKATKNLFACEYMVNYLRDLKTVGIISEDPVTGITEVAEPVGVVAGLTPVTNPTSTAIFKSLLALKTRNPIIFAFHPNAQKCSAEAARIVYEAALKAGAPENCIQWIDHPSMDATSALMNHPGVSTILATGGNAMVKAAYSCGKPALGVGAGNAPAYIETTADIKQAVNDIAMSKAFDNGMICASEQTVIVDENIYEDVKAEFKHYNVHFCSPKEKKLLETYMFGYTAHSKGVENAKLNGAVAGKPAAWIAEQAGFKVDPQTSILIAELEKPGVQEPLSREKLSPVLAMEKASSVEDGFDKAEATVMLNGVGHTAAIHTRSEELAKKFGERIKACRLIWNSPTTFGGIGNIYNSFIPSLTLGCGSYGHNSVSGNVSAINLINIKKIGKRRNTMQWFKIPSKIYIEQNSITYLRDMREINRAFIVTDRTMVDLGYVSRITEQLAARKNKVQVQLFCDVEPDPSLQTVKKGWELMQAFKPDTIIALGGGSSMDAAKGMWLFYEHPEVDFADLKQKFMDIRKRAFQYPELGKKSHLVCIPTTSGTGSEVSPFAVITDKVNKLKYPLADYSLTPTVAIVDPALVMSLPAQVTADSGMDVLTHACEAYVSVMATDYTDALALKAVQMVFEYLPRAVHYGAKDEEAREKMHNASTMAGMAFANAYLGMCHSMAHKIGAEFHTVHGRTCGTLLPYVIRYNGTKPEKPGLWPKYQYYNADERYCQLAHAIGLKFNTVQEGVEKFAKAVHDLGIEVGMAMNFKSQNVDKKEWEESLEKLAYLSYEDQCSPANPRVPMIKDMIELMRAAYEGTEIHYEQH
ncbi:bifunctional acetaldehyde-CoA/alcohol dehydrogenase [uncultured Solobacterium sp.]|uniref:bifunctional acetaldehyde-CoA/alcohol dehydrogenase n=1 Tax=uncultured Solobacterium sp. TaxID=747375 RepID=UPI0028EEB979|nr:bifunctional acetaldehyde-CoA/alcohol dehydrogenase [uncultured Solobacterium sp.]